VWIGELYFRTDTYMEFVREGIFLKKKKEIIVILYGLAT
jgi:hypothetical protein